MGDFFLCGGNFFWGVLGFLGENEFWSGGQL